MVRVAAVQLLYAFALGVSFAVTFVTVAYLSYGYDHANDPPAHPSKDTLEIGARLMYGVANVINVALGNTVIGAAVVGAWLGEILSLVGRFGFNLPTRVFNMQEKDAWRVHAIAPIIYALIFVLIVRPLNARIITYL